MSDRMLPPGFEALLLWLVGEKRTKGTAFGVPFAAPGVHSPVAYQGRTLEVPFGPAAGPHTQLAANIVSAYLSGARYFELKTVQVIDGENLHVDKPCIWAKNEGYNVEWSTELTVQQAFEEYAKAWFLLKLISREFFGGNGDGFIFNMSVGYDLEGIRSLKIDHFIDSMKDASRSPIWREMKETARRHLGLFERVDDAYIRGISPKISDSVTLSTLHGCPAGEIGRIAEHLMREKRLHTAVKCNPTLSGPAYVRQALDRTGFDDLEYDPEVFGKDLTLSEAVALIKSLKKTADDSGVEFSVKLTNTFPVKNRTNRLAGETAYVSGSALYPLSVHAAAVLSASLGGNVHLSYSGGADETNIAALAEAGLWPITVSTRLLKPNGYKSLTLLAKRLEAAAFGPTDPQKLAALAEDALTHRAPGSRRSGGKEKSARDETGVCFRCNNCVDVCPNRANVGFVKDGDRLAVHIDALCNECGSCAAFCPMGYTPYRDKLTLFHTLDGMETSANDGFLSDNGEVALRSGGEPEGPAKKLIEAIKEDAPYILRI